MLRRACAAGAAPGAANDGRAMGSFRHRADFSVTAKGYVTVTAVVHALAAYPSTVWTPALGAETEKGSEIAAPTATLLGRTLRLIVRRQPKHAGDQLAFDDLDDWRLHAIITNVDAERMSAAEVEAHHRLRGAGGQGLTDHPVSSTRLRFAK